MRTSLKTLDPYHQLFLVPGPCTSAEDREAVLAENTDLVRVWRSFKEKINNFTKAKRCLLLHHAETTTKATATATARVTAICVRVSPCSTGGFSDDVAEMHLIVLAAGQVCVDARG